LNQWKIYTPDGVQDFLFKDCFQKKNIEEKARKLFRSWGYMEIETPTIEFYDTFSSNNKLIPQEEMFKFYDQQGRILVLRPDLTIPVARVAATHDKDNTLPMKYFYIGNCYKYREMGGGKQKEYTQAGVELLGDSSVEADAEVIATAIYAAKAAGIEKFQVDIGQVEFFKGLVEELGLDESEAESFRSSIDKKDYLGVEEIVKAQGVKSELKDLIQELPGLFGSSEILEKAEKVALNERSQNAIKYLRELLGILEEYGLSQYVSIDLGMVQSLSYYTGIIFRGVTYDIGFPFISGGRYDKLVEKYGRNCPATGFSMGINLVLAALQRQKVELSEPKVDTLVFCESGARELGFKLSNILRDMDVVVQLDFSNKLIDAAKDFAKAKGIGGVIRLFKDGKIEVYETESGKVTNTTIEELAGDMT